MTSLSDKLTSQFERAKDNQNYNFLYLTNKEISFVFDYHKKKYLKEKSRIIVKVFSLDDNKWLNLDPVNGITDENGNATTDHELLTGLQGGIVNEHFHFSNAEHSKILVGNYISDWNASSNTPSIPISSPSNKDQFYRVTTAGLTTIDGFTDWEIGDLIFSTGIGWVKLCTNDQAKAAKFTTILDITGTILAGTPLSLIASGINYTKSKDNGNIGSTTGVFEDREASQVYRNGVIIRKSDGTNPKDVNYISSTSISFNFDLKAGETIIILS